MPSVTLTFLSLVLLLPLSSTRRSMMRFEEVFPILDYVMGDAEETDGHAKRDEIRPTMFEAKQWLDDPDADILETSDEEKERHGPKMKEFDSPIEELSIVGNVQLFTELYLGKRVLLEADEGGVLTRCYNCGGAKFKNSASIGPNYGSPEAVWTVSKVRGQITFQADNGYFLSSCTHCWHAAAFPDHVFVQTKDCRESEEALWKPTHVTKNEWTFRSDQDLFLTRCHNCVVTGKEKNFAFLNTKEKNKMAIWKVHLAADIEKGLEEMKRHKKGGPTVKKSHFKDMRQTMKKKDLKKQEEAKGKRPAAGARQRGQLASLSLRKRGSGKRG